MSTRVGGATMFRTLQVSDTSIFVERDGKLMYLADKPRWSINIFDEPEEKEAPNGVVL
jgi:hypothetical protein